jgi:hypothetical protein
MQMIQQTDELLTAIQYVMLGKLPVNLINPTTLQNILRNVSLQLPGGFDLIFVTKTENIHLLYEIANVTAVANVHGIKLIINVPLKQLVNYLRCTKYLSCLRGFRTTILFNIQFIFPIFQLISASENTFCLRKQITIAVKQEKLLYAQPTWQYTAYK